ncbi:choice-of-anchor A family protein [Lactobacillus amylovorus]|uniref:choice-of-anchor A family protein n=1 Tax=Lactobacillus amylovorus TaxID=1604 RepID=UPI003F8886FF
MWKDWTKQKAETKKVDSASEVQPKLDKLLTEISSQDYYQKSWSKLKASLDSASDTQLLALTPAQLQSWKNTIEAQNKLIGKTNEYTAFEKAWTDWSTAEKPTKKVAAAFRTMFDKYATLVNLLPDSVSTKEVSSITSVADLRDYFDNNALLRAANLFHIFGRHVILDVDTNGNMVAHLLSDKVDFGTRGDSFNHTAGDIYYIEDVDRLNENGFRNAKGNYIIFGSKVKVEIKNNVVYANGTKLDKITPSQVITHDDFIDISAEFKKLSQKSKDLMSEKTSANVTVDFKDNNNEIIDVSNASSHTGFVYATLNGKKLDRSGTFEIKGLNRTNAPVLIINVTGSNIHFQPNMKIDGQGSGESHSYPNKVLWNFGDAKTVSINSGNLMGSVLAPNATFTTNVNVDGNIIADTIKGAGGETHRWDLHAFDQHGKNSTNPTKKSPVPNLPEFPNWLEIASAPKGKALPTKVTSLDARAPWCFFGKSKLPDFWPFTLDALAPQPKKTPGFKKPTPGPKDKTPQPPTSPVKPKLPPASPTTPSQPQTPTPDVVQGFVKPKSEKISGIKYVAHQTKMPLFYPKR